MEASLWFMVIEILTEGMWDSGMCIVHQLNFAIVCFVYELVLQHGIFTVTCVCVATPQRVSENSEGCQTTPKGVKVISWHSRSVSKHLSGVDEHTGVIENPQRVSNNSAGC